MVGVISNLFPPFNRSSLEALRDTRASEARPYLADDIIDEDAQGPNGTHNPHFQERVADVVALMSEKRWQATRRSAPDSFSKGVSTRHRANASGQRG
jgi:hypothetical protein